MRGTDRATHQGAPRFCHLRFAARRRRRVGSAGSQRWEPSASVFESAGEIQAYTGIAPVVRQSGNTRSTHCRQAYPHFLRQTFHEWAAHSIMKSEWAREYYEQQLSRGNKHHAAVRSLAFKWIRILFRCWKDRVPYDESIYRQARNRRLSPAAAADGRL